ncbi:MAG: tetratricopeptide repeat protein [Planctomycetes bacterium]|nr:tetratricopeptide repeat protein [Planctomycetota bacterium]
MNKNLKGIAPYFILSIISIIVFCNTLGNTFVYDDSVTIVNNNLIKNWKNFHTLFSFNYFILSGELSYRPLVTLTYFIDYSLWGLNPSGFHLTNLLLQTANTLLFYVFLKRVMRANLLAFFSALLFTTHPVLTETVNSISYREDLLAALFFLIAFTLFLKINEQSSRGVKFILYYAGSLCSYLLSLFSKEMAITLPILLILFDIFYSSSGNSLRTLIKKLKSIYIGYFCITGFYLFIQFVVFRHVYVRLDQTRQSLFAMLKVLASYIKLLFLPFNLNADYVVPPVTTGIVSFVISAFLVTAVIIITIRMCKNNRHYRFFILWFFVALLPVSNIIPIGNVMAERYLYLPIMGFSVIIGIFVNSFNFKKPSTAIWFTIVIITLGTLCICRNGVWRDELSVWYSTVKREPRSARAHHNIGVVHSAKGFYDYAEFEYKKTLEINPRDTEAHYNLGNAYERKDMLGAAAKEYQEAIQYNPYYADAYNNLGSIYKKRLFFDKAAELYKRAIRCNPFNPNYYNNLGLAYHETKLYREAVGEFTKAIKINPKIPSTHNLLGNTYKEMGNVNAAMVEYKTAIELDAAIADSHNNLGIIYTNTGLLEDAIQEFETAIQLDPKFANVHNNLGIAHAKKGDFDKAVIELNKAVALGFDNADVHNNLAGVYLTNGLTDNAITELKLALKYDPKDSNAHCNLGNAYISKSFWDEAIAELKEAIKYNPADAEIYYYLGNAFYAKERYSEAADAFNHSIQYKPNNPQAHKMLGVIYANYLNSPSNALFHLNETLRLDTKQTMAKEITEAINKLKIKISND